MKNKIILELALLAGEIMLRNGAETYRVEDTISRVLSSTNTKLLESFVTPTGIFISIDGDEKEPYLTIVKRVKSRSINLQKIDAVNDLCRRFVAQKISVQDTFTELKKIDETITYPKWFQVVSTGLVAAFFTIMFKGNIADFFASFYIGIVMQLVILFFQRYDVSKFMFDFVGGMVVVALAILFSSVGLGKNIPSIILGCIMPLVPGVAITNAVRDTIAGDLISGISRAVEAFFIATAIASGVASVLSIWVTVFGGVF